MTAEPIKKRHTERTKVLVKKNAGKQRVRGLLRNIEKLY